MARAARKNTQERKKSGQVSAQRCPTGIPGVDDILEGGLPRGRPILIAGSPGSGKTVFCLQTLVNGARDMGEPGLYLSFEERGRELQSSIQAFDWKGPIEDLHFHDAMVIHSVESSGPFEIAGLIAIIEHLCTKHGIRRVVLDGIDVLMGYMGEDAAEHRELQRLLDWVRNSDRTCLITAKDAHGPGEQAKRQELLQFVVDCIIHLERRIAGRISQRTMVVVKYRGSAHGVNAYPFVITSLGISALYLPPHQKKADPKTTHRSSRKTVSTGVRDIDKMFDGGLTRGSTTLITGQPGTAKTTLAGAFVEAACERGERTLLVLFDEYADRVVANLRSVNIALDRALASGLLRIEYRIASASGPDDHVAAIQNWISEHEPTCIAIDPLSAINKSIDANTAVPAIEHLVQAMRARDITCVLTSLTDGSTTEASGAHVSTVADTWVHLSYAIQRGERNRALTIIKARGIAHSGSVREMILSNDGISLAAALEIDGELLMGRARAFHEEDLQERAALAAQDAERERLARQLERQAVLDQIDALKGKLASLEALELKGPDRARPDPGDHGHGGGEPR